MRLFIAIHTPSEVSGFLTHLQNRINRQELLRAKFVDVQNSHMTLSFLGEQAVSKEKEIRQGLREIVFSKFSVHITKTGFFPKRGTPRVIWAGVKPTKPCLDLHGKIQAALKPAVNLDKQHKIFQPHITLARVKEVHSIKELKKSIRKKIKPIEFEVNRFGLYESKLSSQGSIYRLLEDYEAEDI